MKERIFITVKTYPNLTNNNGELVCTAGITEDGSWRRIYPVAFRDLESGEQFKKYQWITVDLNSAAPRDKRPESRKINLGVPIVVEPVPQNQRHEIIFANTKVYTTRSELLDDMKKKRTSLAIFKPSEVLRMTSTPTAAEWDPKKLQAYKAREEQLDIFTFSEESRRKTREAAQKIPFTFRYHFKDAEGHEIRMMVEDWEIGMLYLHSLKSPKCQSPEQAAEMTAEKYMKLARERDIHFFLGTSWERQQKKSPDPFIIVGVYYPHKTETEQMTMF